jgi:hypothetical protein
VIVGRPIQLKEVLSPSAQFLMQHPEQIADAWRRMRYAEDADRVLESALEGALLSFLQEIGAQLAGATGSAWSRTTGVLRLCRREGISLIRNELATLRRVLGSALEAGHASVEERLAVNTAIDEALSSAVLAHEYLLHPERPAQDLRFGGVVVERVRFSAPPRRRPVRAAEESFLVELE